jgi:chlorobactene glucosyltransferase
MSISIMISYWVLLAISAVVITVFTAILLRVLMMSRDGFGVRRGLSLPPPKGGWPMVSIIVPAHNEERVIDACATSLRRVDYPNLEIIFVLDRCTDSTESIVTRHRAEDDRVHMVVNEACPDDWAGKCNAARLGAQRSTGAYLLFTDADTQFDPGLVRATIAVAIEMAAGLVSILSSLTSTHFFEWCIQPTLSMSLITLYPLRRVNRDVGQRPFANGQFLLFSRKQYESIGGHAGVKDAILEDIAFARAVADDGGRSRVLRSDGMLRVSMYGTLDAFKRGWQRIFVEACNRRPGRMFKTGVRQALFGVLIPISILGLVSLVVFGDIPNHDVIASWIVVGVICVLWCLSLWVSYTINGTPKWAIIIFPIGCVWGGLILIDGVKRLKNREPIQWGGRSYIIEPQ